MSFGKGGVKGCHPVCGKVARWYVHGQQDSVLVNGYQCKRVFSYHGLSFGCAGDDTKALFGGSGLCAVLRGFKGGGVVSRG